MATERGKDYSQDRLEHTKSRLHTLSLFSNRDFASPADILKLSIKKARLMDKTLLGRRGFANDIFVDFAKTGDPNQIKYNELLATIFSIYIDDDTLQHQQNKRVSKMHDWIYQVEINDVIESLSGTNSDYISNKKNFSISKRILPAYLIIRSFKENNSIWLDEILSNFNNEEKIYIKDSVRLLRQRLTLAVDSQKEHNVLLKQFNISAVGKSSQLNQSPLTRKTLRGIKEEIIEHAKSIDYEIPKVWFEKKPTKEKKIPIYNNQESRTTIVDTKIKSYTNFNDKNFRNPDDMDSLPDYFVGKKYAREDMRLPVFDYFHKNLMINFESGKAFYDISRILKIIKDEYLGSLTGLLQPLDLAPFFAINIYASEKKHPLFTMPTQADLLYVKGFSQLFKEIMTKKETFTKLSKIYRQAIKDEAYGKIEFSALNQEIAGLLYKAVFNKSHTPSILSFFIEAPLCKKTIKALEKLFIIKLVENKEDGGVTLNQPNIKIEDLISKSVSGSEKYKSRKITRKLKRIKDAIE